ncbi:heparinase II/III family protein, partial [Alcaligenes aquatilis]|uniref:heparinase II/III family protein n=1 Tax=Alcaligenes aquatilis TaxID=323284 RepID=UPI003D224329
FQWKGLDRDRNWWWQLQALPFLNWYINSYELQSDEEKERFYKFCLASIRNWLVKTKESESPLAWHDHATAFRVRNIVNWLVFCEIKGLNKGRLTEKVQLTSVIFDHLDWLTEDRNFSFHTNHGFDQAMIVLTVSLMFDGVEFDSYKKINRNRLKEEISYAFTDEGVHKENSPGYQKFMLSRLKQLNIFSLLGDEEISSSVELYLKKAESFLKAITLPNGYLPLVGDTRLETGLLETQDEVDSRYKGYAVFDYSKSGYMVIKGKDGKEKEFYILLKNCHQSNYHRHDDDMMVFVFYDGDVVLGDAGLYNHQEKDIRRVNVRSFLGHSVPYISKNAIRNKDLLIVEPKIERVDEMVFKMESSMFGLVLSREIRVVTEPNLSITIKDSMPQKDSEEVWSNFFIPECPKLHWEDRKLLLGFKGFLCEIYNVHYSEVESCLGWEEAGIEKGAYFSEEYGVLKPALRISFK